jgi:hypothetical protein
MVSLPLSPTVVDSKSPKMTLSVVWIVASVLLKGWIDPVGFNVCHGAHPSATMASVGLDTHTHTRTPPIARPGQAAARGVVTSDDDNAFGTETVCAVCGVVQRHSERARASKMWNGRRIGTSISVEITWVLDLVHWYHTSCSILQVCVWLLCEMASYHALATTCRWPSEFLCAGAPDKYRVAPTALSSLAAFLNQ